MLKVLQARLQQYVNCELSDVQVGLRKGRGTRDQIFNICWIIEKAREFPKKHLHDPDNHDGMIIHLKPDILESEIKWALGSITTNKASGGDRIPVELFQILKDDAVEVLHSIRQQICKT